MRTANGNWNLIDKKQWTLAIVFLLCFPAITAIREPEETVIIPYGDVLLT